MAAKLIVIGAGSAGCAAALEAARHGSDVTLVDRSPLPGVGGWARGTLPAAILRGQARAAAHGAGGERGSALRQLRLDAFSSRRKEVLAEHLVHTRRLLEAAHVRFLNGRARLCSSSEVMVEGHGLLRADTIVIAAGSRPRRPASFPFDGCVVCDEESIFRLETLPRSLVIVGAEVVGCEFACLFAALGVNVTLIERRRRLLRCVDPDLLELLHARMQQLGIVVSVEEDIETLVVEPGAGQPHASLRLASGRVEKCDRLLVLAGREPQVRGLDLGRAAIQTDARGFITVDEHQQTSQPGIYAVGDVVGYPFRIGAAHYQARVSMLHATGGELACGGEPPLAIYTIPEIAVVGLIEEAVRRLDLPYGVGCARLDTTFAGRISAAGSGLLKLVFARDGGGLLGVQILGDGATELVHLGAAWLQTGTTLEQIAATVFNYPSLAEAYRVAALDGLARARAR